MEFKSSIIKHYLRNVMFINGTAYAGKSTMVKMLSEKYNLVHCGENYDCFPEGLLTPYEYPNLCYEQTKKDWQEFFNRTPEEYSNWVIDSSWERIDFEVSYLMSISQSQKVIVDTNIPPEILHEIADYNQVAIMLAPRSMSIEHFFDCDDPRKKFLKEQIEMTDDPQMTMDNFRNCIAEVNSQENYDEWLNSEFFTIIRKDAKTDSKLETLNILAKHFKLEK